MRKTSAPVTGNQVRGSPEQLDRLIRYVVSPTHQSAKMATEGPVCLVLLTLLDDESATYAQKWGEKGESNED